MYNAVHFLPCRSTPTCNLLLLQLDLSAASTVAVNVKLLFGTGVLHVTISQTSIQTKLKCLNEREFGMAANLLSATHDAGCYLTYPYSTKV